MRKMIATLLALMLVASGVQAVSAQDAGSSFASGVDAPVTWMDASGNPTATLTVNDQVSDFQDYDPESRSGPDYGYSYQMVQFTVENVSDKAIIVERGGFYVVDSFGEVYSDIGLPLNGEPQPLMEGDVALAAGETVQHTGLYEIPAHGHAQLFNWRPTPEVSLLIDMTTELPESGAMARGMNTSSTVVDDFGNPIYSFEVTGHERDWSGYSEIYVPEPGTSYHAVHIRVTNMNERPVLIDAFDYNLLDSNGNVVRAERVRVEDGVEPAPLRTQEELAPGESMDVMMVFALEDGRDPVVLTVRIAYNVMNTVVLAEGGANAPVATPEADATPTGN